MIIDSENDYVGALKGNQSGLLKAVRACFKPQQSNKKMNKGHGRIEKRTVSISHNINELASPYRLSARTNLILNPNSTSSVTIEDANLTACTFQKG